MDLRSASIIDPDIEGHYVSYPLVEQISTQEHCHDFFEIFLIADGSIYHHVNGDAMLLRTGNLVFIRPEDAHFFSKNANQNCKLINLAFFAHTFKALLAYLEPADQGELLLTSALPPTVLLTASETNLLVAQLEEWGRLMYRHKGRSRLALRVLLARLITEFFIARVEDYGSDVPQWLIELCQNMQTREHIIEGRGALMRLANRAPEYVGRSFKAYLGLTPSQFINELRLDFACDLLLHTERTVTDICYAVGFGNLSHFYHLFKARWQCTPIQFRQINRRTLIPIRLGT